MELTREQITRVKQVGYIDFEGIKYNVVNYAIRQTVVHFELKKNVNCSTCLEVKVSVPLVKGELNLAKVKKL